MVVSVTVVSKMDQHDITNSAVPPKVEQSSDLELKTTHAQMGGIVVSIVSVLEMIDCVL